MSAMQLSTTRSTERTARTPLGFHRASHRGVSLVEILVTLVILVFGMLAVARLFPQGFASLGFTASRNVSESLRVILTGENLLDVQRGEPDNITVLPGRTITFGVRAEF